MERIPKTKPAIDLPFVGAGGVEADNSSNCHLVDSSLKSPPIEIVIECS